MDINGENLILGRLASKVATLLLRGEDVNIYNAEKVVMTGSLDYIHAKLKIKRGLKGKGNPFKGPKFHKNPEKLVKQSVAGMLPRKEKRGRDALARLKVYLGLPKEIDVKKMTEIDLAKNKLKEGFVELGTVSKLLGAKW